MAEAPPTPDSVKQPDFNPEPLPPYLESLYANLAVIPQFEEKKGVVDGETNEQRNGREAENAAIQERNILLQKEADVLHATRVALVVFDVWSKKRIAHPFTQEEFLKEEVFEKFYAEINEMSDLMLSVEDSLAGFYRQGKFNEVFTADTLARKYLLEEDLVDEQGNEKVKGAKEKHEITITNDPDLVELRKEKGAIIWHDLSQPFTGMKGYGGLYRRQLARGRATEQGAHNIQDRVNVVPDYIDDVNTLIENESFPDEAVPVQFILQRGGRVFNPERVTIDEDAKDKVIPKNSKLWLRILFRNALKNAHEAHASEVKLNVSLSEDKKYIEMTIDDNGDGIPDEIIESKFKKGKTTKADEGGTGTAMGTLVSFAEKLYPGTILEPQNTPEGGRIFVRMPLEQAA